MSQVYSRYKIHLKTLVKKEGKGNMAMIRHISKSKARRRCVGIAVICLALLILTGMNSLSGKAWAAEEIQFAPVNPAFEQYLNQTAYPNTMLAVPATVDGHALGHIPPIFKLQPPPETATAHLAAALPAAFDLRTSSPAGVTPVRNQFQCGSCWTFGAMASLESYIKYKGATTADFSEADLNENHGFDYGVCMGGHWFMSTAYMARWGGPVTEADVPYPSWFTMLPEGSSSVAEAGIPRAAGATPGAANAYRVQNVYWLPQQAKPLSAEDITTLKTAIKANGAVDVAYYADSTFYDSTNHSFYCSESGTVVTHEVAIVGWDDAYAKTKFKAPQPPGNGAFIVKNSWGTGWGESGYFYMSYYDKSLEIGAQFYDAEPLTTYTRAYQYDPLGLTTSVGFTGGDRTMAWYSNIFMASANAPTIKAVGTYALSPNASYTVEIWKNVAPGKPRSGTKVATKSGTLAKPGYNTILLTTPAVVAANKPFSVVVKMTNPGNNWPVPIESTASGYSSAASSCPGQSFLSHDGTVWTDASGDPEPANNFNVCLKALAVK